MFVHSFLVALLAAVPSLVSATGICVGGVAPYTTITDVNNPTVKWALCAGSDLTGDTLNTLTLVTSYQTCINACNSNPACNGFQYYNGQQTCSLRSTADMITASTFYHYALVRIQAVAASSSITTSGITTVSTSSITAASPSTSTSPLVTTIPSSSSSTRLSTSTSIQATTTTSAVIFTTLSTSSSVTTAAPSVSSSSTPLSTTAPLATIPPSTSSSTTFSTATRSTTSSFNSATGACYGGAAPQSTQTASNGDVYGVCPGTDFYGGDLTSSPADSVVQCAEACSKTNGCIAAALTSGTCWQKNVRNDANSNNNVVVIYKISSGTKPTTKTTTASTTTGGCYGGATPKSTKTASNGDKYGVCSGNDFNGGDMPGQPIQASNLKACYEACSKQSGCVAVAFEDNSCYLKSTRNEASVVSFVDAAYKITSGSTTDKKDDKSVKCQQVTTGYLCPSTEVYYKSSKKLGTLTMCNVSKDDAATACVGATIVKSDDKGATTYK